MKIRSIAIATLSVVLLSACGESEPEAPEVAFCDCMDLNLELIKELGFEGMNDEEKIKAFEAEHQETLDICDSLSQEMNDEMKDLDQMAQKAKLDSFIEVCPAAGEIQQVMEEMQQKYMEEAMKNMNQEGLNGEGDLEGLLEEALEEGAEAIEAGVDAVEDELGNH